MSVRDDVADLFELAPCGLAVLDANGRIVRTNATLASWMGYGTVELAQKRFQDLLSVSGRIFHETHLAPLLLMRGTIEEMALELVAADGERLPVLVNATRSAATSGQDAITRVAIFRAAERRRYERDLVEAKAEARSLHDQIEETNAALTRHLEDERDLGKLREEFIAVLGHDLRNPLASIQAGAKLLHPEAPSPKATRILTLMEGSVLRMSGLIDNVLDFARGRLGDGITLDRTATESLEPVLRQVIDELQSGTGRDIVVEFDMAAPVDCDRARIAQMASNLLGNALTHGAADQPITIMARSTSTSFEVSVANGGEPISPGAMEHLFQPFFRGGVQPSKQGLGLGLHIASQIAKAHGGTIGVRSSEDETRFTFRMPMPSGAMASADLEPCSHRDG